MTLVLEGEQHLAELQPDGTSKSIVRKKGNCALASVDALVHDEWGGDDGGGVVGETVRQTAETGRWSRVEWCRSQVVDIRWSQAQTLD